MGGLFCSPLPSTGAARGRPDLDKPPRPPDPRKNGAGHLGGHLGPFSPSGIVHPHTWGDIAKAPPQNGRAGAVRPDRTPPTPRRPDSPRIHPPARPPLPRGHAPHVGTRPRKQAATPTRPHAHTRPRGHGHLYTYAGTYARTHAHARLHAPALHTRDPNLLYCIRQSPALHTPAPRVTWETRVATHLTPHA